MVLLIGIASACQRSGENTNKPVSPTNANTKSGEVAIEISSEALGKEWLRDRAGTDNKYKGKTLSISGEVWVAEQIGDQVFVHFIGVPVPLDAKTGGAKITCITTPTADARLLIEAIKANERMIRETNQKGLKMPQTRSTVKGVYWNSSPPDRIDGFVELRPCKVSMFK